MITPLPLPDDIQTDDQTQTRPARGPRIDIRQRLDREHRRLPDREAQRRLRERLRYKHAGTLSNHMQEMGDGARNGRGVWFWVFIATMLLAYVNRFGLRGW